jgi:glycosyltransferase involved in cell wall biosynthesis
LIRDDGSTDNTMQIIEEYARNDSRIHYYVGENLGVRNSFFDLMKNADLSSDYYALSDQDDVWLEDKITRAVSMMDYDEKIPVLYASETQLVDQELKPIKSQIRRPVIVPSFGNALVENICTGCTCLFNRELLIMVREHIPDFTVMHDWWLYLTASAYGRVIYDMEAYILYRQHGDNIVGTKATYLDEFRKRLKNYRINRGQIRKQLLEFHRLYNIEIQERKYLDYIINSNSSFINRLITVFNHKVYRQRKLDDIIFKILILCGQI